MIAAIVDGYDLNVLPPALAINLLVLDPQIRKMDVFIEIRQLVFGRPCFNFMNVPLRATIRVFALSIGLVQPALVLALLVVIQEDAVDSCTALTEPICDSPIRLINLSAVFELTAALYAR